MKTTAVHVNELERQRGRGAWSNLYKEVCEAFPCEYCGADPGAYCTTPDGRPCVAYVHKARAALARPTLEDTLYELTNDAVQERRAKREADAARMRELYERANGPRPRIVIKPEAYDLRRSIGSEIGRAAERVLVLRDRVKQVSSELAEAEARLAELARGAGVADPESLLAIREVTG